MVLYFYFLKASVLVTKAGTAASSQDAARVWGAGPVPIVTDLKSSESLNPKP